MALTKIKTGGIADNAITNAKMADDAIDSADFANASIDNIHVATGLDAVKLADGTVTVETVRIPAIIHELASQLIPSISPKLSARLSICVFPKNKMNNNKIIMIDKKLKKTAALSLKYSLVFLITSWYSTFIIHSPTFFQ